jgi:fatty acid desaturase
MSIHDADTLIIARPPRKRRPRWRRWYVIIPAAALAALIAITALGAAIGQPIPVKTTVIKTTTATAYQESP